MESPLFYVMWALLIVGAIGLPICEDAINKGSVWTTTKSGMIVQAAVLTMLVVGFIGTIATFFVT